MTAFPGQSAEGAARSASTDAPGTSTLRRQASGAKAGAEAKATEAPTGRKAGATRRSRSTTPTSRDSSPEPRTKVVPKEKAPARSTVGARPKGTRGRNSPLAAVATKTAPQPKTTPTRVRTQEERTPPGTAKAQTNPVTAKAMTTPVTAAPEPAAETESRPVADIAAPDPEPITLNRVTATFGVRMSDAGPIIVPLSMRNAEGAPTALTTAAAEPPALLGTAGDFAILAGTTITNSGVTTVTGDVGLDPGTAVTGFESCTGPANCVILTGQLHVDDGAAAQAKADLLTAYNELVGLESTCTSLGVELGGGIPLLPGVYCSPTFELTGTLTLDGNGLADPVFIFLTGSAGSTLTTAAGSSVVLINGANACNVFWQVATSASLGAASSFAGNILAATSISFGSAATLQGRALASNGAATLIGNTITRADCGTGTIPPDDPPPPDDPTPPVDPTPPGDGTPPRNVNRPGSGNPTGSGTPSGRTTTGLTTTRLTTTGLTTTGLTTTGLTTGVQQAGEGGPTLAMTGSTVRIKLRLAGMAIGLGALMIVLSRLRRRSATS